MTGPHTWILVVVALLFAAACSTDDGGEVADRTSSTTSLSTSSSTTTSSTTQPPSDAELAVEAWDTAWTLATTDGSRADQLVDAGVATPDAAAQFVAIASLNTDRTRREILRHPTTAQVDGGLAVNDCMFITPPLTTASASFYQGTIEISGREARVTGLKAISPSGCIPREINDQVLEDYDEYWRGLDDVSENLKSLDQDRISEVTTGQHRENVLAAARRFSESGDELRDDPTLHPEVMEWRDPTTVVILDCQQADPEFGLYADGRRLTDLPAPVPGQLDLREVTMTLENGRWKVSDRQGSANTSCEFAPTSFGVPVV